MKKLLIACFCTICLVGCKPSTDNYVPTVNPQRSIRIMLANANKSWVNNQFALPFCVDLVRNYQPEFLVLGDVAMMTTSVENRDLVTETAYHANRIALWGPSSLFDGGELGVGALAKNHFEGFKLRTISENLTALETYVKLPSTEILNIVAVHLNAASMNQASLGALATAYANAQEPLALALSLEKPLTSEEKKTLASQFTILGLENGLKENYPVESPVDFAAYVVTPKHQKWGVMSAETILNVPAVGYLPVVMRIGLCN